MNESNVRNDRQAAVAAWVLATFGDEVAMSRRERALRFLEEATELAQACGLEEEDAARLQTRVFSRPKGEPSAEAGGVGTTLLALAHAFDFSADEAERWELARLNALPAGYFTQRHAAKVAAGVAA